MKRKLVSYDAFTKIVENSMTKAEAELVLAEDVLSKALDCGCVELVAFTESDVTYKTCDDEFVHASYEITNDQIVFENIEAVIVDEQTERDAAKAVVGELLEALLEDNTLKAEERFQHYFSLPVIRREIKLDEASLNEEAVEVTVSKPHGAKKRRGPQSRSLVAKRIREMKKTKARRRSSGQDKVMAGKADRVRGRVGSNPRGRVYVRKVGKMHEWSNLIENVFGWVDHKQFGPLLRESSFEYDDRDNLVALRIPTSAKRNEGKILSYGYDTMDHEVKILRSKVKTLHEDTTFVRAVSDLKRAHHTSDDAALEQTLENVVEAWPQVLYLTQQELAEAVKIALETAGVKLFDDATCEYLAEGILRTAHSTYVDRVTKISKLAGLTVEASDENGYEKFRDAVATFYPKLDVQENRDISVFSDLLITMTEVYRAAHAEGDTRTMNELAVFMNDCKAVVDRKTKPNAELAEAAAEYLNALVEAVRDGAEWTVDNSAHTTINGDHPAMFEKGRTTRSASDAPGEWPDSAPVSDGSSYRNGLADEMRGSSWGNIANSKTYPDVTNPYLPEPFGDYTMKGEPGVDKNADSEGLAQWQSDKTFPNHVNPYLPSDAAARNLKMNANNLVVDK